MGAVFVGGVDATHREGLASGDFDSERVHVFLGCTWSRAWNRAKVVRGRGAVSVPCSPPHPVVLGESVLIDPKIKVLADASSVQWALPAIDGLVVVVTVDEEVGHCDRHPIEKSEADIDNVGLGVCQFVPLDEARFVVLVAAVAGYLQDGVFLVPEEQLLLSLL